MRILVTGSNGQLGHDVVAAAAAAGDDVVAHDRSSLDVTDADQVRERVADADPGVVVNCAAFTAVDACEAEGERAYAVNEGAVANLARACSEAGAHLVHVSTDYVFDGELDRPYREDDETNPRSVYGASKLAGERAAAEILGDAATVVRTSWVCGEHGANMVKTVLRLADSDTPLAFVDDQRGCPTFTTDLAVALRTLAAERAGGVVHVTNSGAVSWYEFVRAVLAADGRDPDRVSPISTADLDPPRPAPRPANSVLDDVAWRSRGHPPMRGFSAPLDELVRRLRSTGA
ncbi:dTDP-4-dehydrorhamnose reductase [Ilumatobacter sp.]|uniref:dTDP-4-dehydrorhamnose reductase n=1 Tax=Ilumatobacter sp. TaxID=1967498 RepID=UPI003B527B37